MKREEAKKIMQEKVGNATLTSVSCSPVGYCTLLDELASDFNVRPDIQRMYQDKAYYIKRGGWDKFTLDNNARFIDEALDRIYSQGYEVTAIDFFDYANGSLFLYVNGEPFSKEVAEYEKKQRDAQEGI